MHPRNTPDFLRRCCHTLPLISAIVTLAALGCVDNDTVHRGIAGLEVAGTTAPSTTDAIVVSTPAELIAAVVPANAGRQVHVRAGIYHFAAPLIIPDGMTLEGEGVMQFDAGGHPAGFTASSRTTLVMTGTAPGDAVGLGDGAAIRRLAIEDRPGRAGNAVGIASRAPGDRIVATIDETEILNPTAHGVAPQGPTGCAVAIVSRNPNMGGEPGAHTGAMLDVRITRSLIRSPATGIGCGVFAFNFAAQASLEVSLTGNIVGGGIIASGGVSRPDLVHDATTVIMSRKNRYRDDSAVTCGSPRTGWNLLGGAGVPVPMPNPGAVRNVLRVHSTEDRIEGFTTGVSASGARRFFAAPLGGAVSDNHVDLQLMGTTIATVACGGVATDLRLSGAQATAGGTSPGDGNTLRALLRGVTGSGSRANIFVDVLLPGGAHDPALQGTGNRLMITGSPMAFQRTNIAVSPTPGAGLFTGGGS